MAEVVQFPKGFTTLESFAGMLLEGLRPKHSRLHDARFLARAREALTQDLDDLTKNEAMSFTVNICGGEKLSEDEKRTTAEEVLRISRDVTWNRCLPMLRQIALLHVKVLEQTEIAERGRP